MLFLDISKAFGKVPHVYLLEKLKMVGIDGNLLPWILTAGKVALAVITVG